MRCLPQLIERAAALTPDAVAVEHGERTISYGELDAASNRVANHLLDLGVSRGDRVGLYLEKSIESVVGLYGAMKAGAAYVPLDPPAPTGRLAVITADCRVACLLTSEAKLGQATEVLAWSDSCPTVALDGDGLGADTSRPSIAAHEEDLAYILYTSGSTGRPKGVMLTHGNALSFVAWATSHFGVSADDRLSSHAPLHFDLSVFDLFAAASAAATVVIVPPRLAMFPIRVVELIRDRQITVWYSVPSILTMLTTRGGLTPGDLPSLRLVLFAGEVFPTRFLRQLMHLVPAARFANLYGPTETNVCTCYDVGELAGDVAEPIPIGRVVADDHAYVVRDDGAEAAPGEPGELWVGGATVMRGYWDDPELTARSLVPDPFRGAASGLVYRTGDVVSRGEDGNLRYLGRRDDQVKSRGYRIELGDIEAAMYEHASVRECAVVAVPDELITNRLRAHVVVDGDVSAPELARFCASRLPRYMVPDHFELHRTLPRTSTGKIDRQALIADPGD